MNERSKPNNSAGARPLRMRWTGWFLAIGWLGVLAVSLAYNWNVVQKSVLQHAQIEARAAFEKDVAYRRWAASHGGVYVPPTTNTPPNPYLAHLPDRDVMTTGGKALTLMNPAYMTRQVYGLSREQYGLRGHITSLHPLRPENAADHWETNALNALLNGQAEVSSVETIDGHSFMRLMRPIVAEAGCIKCHPDHSYNPGKIGGGISLSVPLAPYQAIAQAQVFPMALAHLALAVAGLAGIAWVQYRQERNLAERLANEERFRWLYEHAPAAYHSLDAEGKILVVNDAWLAMLGFEQEEVICRPITEFLAPESVPLFQERFPRFQATGRNSGAELEFIHKDGTRVLVTLECRIGYDAQGNVLQTHCVLHNITERHRMHEGMEKRLIALTQPLDAPDGIQFDELFSREEIQKLQDQFAQATGVASIITFPDGRPITRPSNFCRLCKDFIRRTKKGLQHCHRSDAALGRHHPDGPIIQQCLSGGLWDAGASITIGGRHIANWLIGQVRNEAQEEAAMRRYAREIGANETELMAAFAEVPCMSLEQFRAVAQTLFTLAQQLSVTAYQNVQQARFIAATKKAEVALQESEERYRLLAENASDVIWAADVETKKFTYVSPAVERMRGYRPEEVVGLEVAMVVTPESYRYVLAQLPERLARFQQGEDVSYTDEVQQPCKNGTTIWTESVSRFRVNAKTGRLEMYGITRDISARKRLEAQLRQAQKMEAVGQLAGGSAHDFNNILAAQLMQLNLLQQNPQLDDETRYSLTELEKGANRAANLVRQLLLFSRQSVKQTKALDLNELIEDLLKMLRRLLGEHISVDWRAAPNLPRVEADPGMIEQVVLNLCVNARDAMPKGGRLTIATQLVEEGAAASVRQVCLSVADTGCGIDEALLQHIFEPFFTTKEVGKGTGLGLATVHGIVQQHNGRVEVQSQVGQGSTFRIYLPALQNSQPAAEQAVKTAAPVGNEVILVVEDEPAVRNILARSLHRHGYHVLEAASGKAALAVWQAHREEIALLFTDMVMPDGMSGLDLTDRLRAEKPGLPVIVSSGYSHEFTHEGTLPGARVTYLPKPYDLSALAKVVRSCLDGQGNGHP